MNDAILSKIALNLGVQLFQVKNTVMLLDEGATIPFISRYRKELTGSLDEVQVAGVLKEYNRFKDIIKRKETILKSLEEQEVLTEDLKTKIENEWDLSVLEDIYLPYKPKRKTRGSMAKAKGLEPLAKMIMAQYEWNIEDKAKSFVKNEVKDVDEALAGARDIIAEWINENARARQVIRKIFQREAVIISKVMKGKEAEGIKYNDYFDWREPLKRCPSHRMLAMRRGQKEGFLKLTIEVDVENSLDALDQIFIRSNTSCTEHVQLAIKDSYKRLLWPSIETEFFNQHKEFADTEAIRVFAENLKQLLMADPLGPTRVMALDPGFRTGCKLVCIDEKGNLLHNETIYPHPPQREVRDAAKKISTLVSSYKIDAIAIGNGTAGRETEQFIKYIRFDRKLKVFSVNEDGASIYSASSIGREEFPQYDVTVRGAVSIGRRLIDPLAELVKIDPKSIGVGQYQHDVDQKKLTESLDTVVELCVNNVGVNLNTASKHLLTHVSGLGPQLAENIVQYRKENGLFQSRESLKKVKRMGEKAYEQSAGFLRIPESSNPLDNSSVHPESYNIVRNIAKDQNVEIGNLLGNDRIIKLVDLNGYTTDKVGLPTLTDIMKELLKPTRDPRQIVKVLEFSDDIRKIEDLKEGMELNGIITNVTKFGAFVDIGIKENGLVHVSEMANRFVKDPLEVVKLQQHVLVKVLSIDFKRKRIQLSMKGVDC